MKKYKYMVSLKELPEEFEMIYQDLCKKNIYDLEKLRNKVKLEKIFMYILGLTFCVCMMLIQGGAYEHAGSIGFFICVFPIFALPSLGILSGRLDKNKREYRMIYKNKVIPEFVKLINNQLKFKSFDNELFKMREEYRMAGFDKIMFNEFDSNDYVEGMVDNDIFIKVCDAHVKFRESGKKHTEHLFKGIFAHTKCDKSIEIGIKIIKNKIKILEQQHRVEMDSVEFEKYFDIYSENKIKAMQLLTSDVMETLTNFYNKYSLDFEIIFKNNTIYMRFFTGPMFEPKIWINSMNKRTLAVYFCILEFIVDVTRNVNKALQNVEI